MRVALPMALAALILTGATVHPRPISFHNRLLLNRAVVSGLSTIEVMLLAREGHVAQVADLIEQAGGRVVHTDDAVGYLRVDLPLDRFLSAVSNPDVEAYQIASFSKAAWYRDAAPRANAEMFRELETTSIGEPPAESVRLPVLPIDRSREAGYTGEDDVGLSEWFANHPTFDGRGVTIGLMENAQPNFSHAVLDGDKLAGILNTIDPDDPDETRVDLDRLVRSASTWLTIGSRTYILPRAGEYRFGLFPLASGGNLVHQFALVQDPSTGDIWIDANGNADFRDERPLVDVNKRVDVRTIKLRHPHAVSVPFVASPGRRQHAWHIYVGRGDHQTMTVSVAAGSKTRDGLAFGVAPGARIFLVRTDTNEYRLRHIVEGYLQAARHPQIDVIAAATGFELVPDTDADFAGLFFNRLIAAWQKPIFQSAGNRQRWLGSVTSLGNAFSVGGTLSPQTFAAMYGGGVLDQAITHPSSAGGPSIDGRVKPDFLAATHRIAAGLSTRARVVVPRNQPIYQLPPGYQISCCTSASSHIAAGLAALLLSGLRQERLPYSFDRLSYALRMGSRFLIGSPAHQQGNGVLDISSSWNLLRSRIEPTAITSTATIVHPLAHYSARGRQGSGIFERDGWTTGATGRRSLRLRRESGPREQTTYRVSWTGNDGTFSAPTSVRLPLNSEIALPVDIAVSTPGAHSALLNLHDAGGAIAFRTQVTIVAADTFDRHSNTLRLTGSVRHLRSAAHYVAVPAGFAALALDLEILHGSAGVNVIPAHGLFPAYQGQIGPQNGRTFTRGRYSLALPYPSPGTWTIDITNTSTRRERNPGLVSDEPVEYRITLRLERATVHVRRLENGATTIECENSGAALRDPVLLTSSAIHTTVESRFLANGLPNVFPVDVPEGTSTLVIHARATSPGTTLELYLYDCSSDECFSHNYTIPAITDQTLVVRKPGSGRWIAAINAGPPGPLQGTFTLETTVAGPPRRSSIRETMLAPHDAQAVLHEVIDGRTERDEIAHPWETRETFPKLPHSPVAAGFILVPVRR